MVVRVLLRLSAGSVSIEVPAIVNTGFESDVPEVIVPEKVAEDLGLYPRVPAGSIVEEYRVAGGGRVTVIRLPQGLARASVVAGDKVSREVEVSLTVVPGERDVLISDAAAEELGIEVVRPKSGVWRFADDPPGVTRRSIP